MFLEANRGLGLDASSEDCLDVFDLKQLLDRSLCVASKYCESYKRVDVSLCFISPYFDATYRLVFKLNTHLYSRVSRDRNRNLCGWKIPFFHIAILSQMQLIVQPYYIPPTISSQSDHCTLRYEYPCIHTLWRPFWKRSKNFHQKRSPLNVHFFRCLSLYFG